MKAEYQKLLDEFTKDMSPLQRSRCEKVLNTLINYSSDGVMTRLEHVMMKKAAGCTVYYDGNGKGKMEYFLRGKTILWQVTKTELEFAKFVGMKEDEKYSLVYAQNEVEMENIRKKYNEEMFFTTNGVESWIERLKKIDAFRGLKPFEEEKLKDLCRYLTLKAWKHDWYEKHD